MRIENICSVVLFLLLVPARSPAIVIDTAVTKTVSDTVTDYLEFRGNGRFLIADNVTISILGPLTAPLKELFAADGKEGTGTVSFRGNAYVKEVYPQWFGVISHPTKDQRKPINKALSSLPAGCRLLFTPGIYCVGSSLLQPSHTEIAGTDRESCVIRLIGTSVFHGGIVFNMKVPAKWDTSAHHCSFNTNLKISDLTLDGNQRVSKMGFGVSYIGVTDVTIRNVRIQHTFQQGIRIMGGKRITVRDCLVDSINMDGIHLADPENFLIEGNRVYHSGDFGIEVEAGTLPGNANRATGFGQIVNNFVMDCKNFGICTRGNKNGNNPHDKPVTDVLIQGNIVTQARQGISLGEYTSNISIIGNDVYSNEVGIGTAPNLTSSSHIIIKGNIVRNNTGSGMDVKTMGHSIISDNIIHDNAAFGIDGSLGHSIISGNSVINNKYGIQLQHCEYTQIVNNIILSKNDYEISENGGGYCSHNLYSGNIIKNKVSLQHHSNLKEEYYKKE
ncbi:MAG: right-handed parallel beta-helix repeat-containing protein [Candidatus Latescibacteria bacterium]|nr:right-handed parallel beta-helix repeat-containing protein [Candidatus Latescibacterota bacterium]